MSDVDKDVQRRRLYWILLVAVVFLVFFIFLSREIVIFWLNISEFGELFIKPIYFGLLGGFVLSALALFRIDFVNRRSVTWWFLKLIVKLARSGGIMEKASPLWFDFDSFKLSPLKFFIWQVAKILVGTVFFINVFFGMAVDAVILGWKLGIDGLPKIFSLPLTTPPINPAYVNDNVVPLMPFLTLIVPPLFRVLWIRLILLVTVTHFFKVIMPFVAAYVWGLELPKLSRFASTVQALGALFLFWIMFNLFFTSFIDYNTRYWILGAGVSGLSLTIFAIWDWRKIRELRVVSGFTHRQTYVRIASLLLILLLVISVTVVNNSIADARKVEMLGPYTAQHVFVNRYFAELDKVEAVPYVFGLTSIPSGQIDGYVTRNRDLLNKVRLWDWEAAFDKLKPEIGLIPYIDFSDSDILRFNGSLYWSASMEPVLPTTVRPEDRWYATRLVYTHVPNGFLMLDGHGGLIIDEAKFFQQRRIYYGEGGLFKEVWIAYPAGRTETTEVEKYFYDGKGGVNMPPPLSWIFEPNFIFSYPTTTLRVLRYRDVYDRMQLLFPYFTYEFRGQYVDVFPVTDGKKTFWAMPLIVFLDTRNVPWSGGNPLGRLVGYALIDAYHGDIQLIILGDDYFSQLFKKVYSEYVSTEVPEWLKPQLRYPEEFFEWRVQMYNRFHVTDPATFITAKEFYTLPRGLDTYYVIAQPPDFEKPEFIGILSLELLGGIGENLAGYMVVRNDYPSTGEMTFYKVSLEAEAKLLGPTAVREALTKDPEYAKLSTLLKNPRMGDHILYRIVDYDVYFIPIYTAPGGGVVTQLASIATVGADFTGKYYVGLGSTVHESFRNFLAKMAGIEAPPPILSEEERIAKLVETFEKANLTVLSPTTVNPDISFLEGRIKYLLEEDWNSTQALVDTFLDRWVKPHAITRVFIWSEDGKVNFGVLIRIEDVLELHYIVVELT